MPRSGDDMTQDRRGWHIDKGVPPAVIITIILAVIGGVVAVVNMAVNQDRRIGSVELTVKHLEQTQEEDRKRARLKYNDLKTDLRIISRKLDRILESDRRSP